MAIKKIGFACLFVLTLCSNACSVPESAPKTETTKTNDLQTWQDVVDYAKKNLPLEGVLKMKKDGFVYLKVEDNYIHLLYPLLKLEDQGYQKPPYFRSAEAPGAHISVFYENERVRPRELGQIFKFELKDILLVSPRQSVSYAILQIEAPELQNLREKYGLQPKLQGHEFHISIAKKKILKRKENQ